MVHTFVEPHVQGHILFLFRPRVPIVFRSEKRIVFLKCKEELTEEEKWIVHALASELILHLLKHFALKRTLISGKIVNIWVKVDCSFRIVGSLLPERGFVCGSYKNVLLHVDFHLRQTFVEYSFCEGILEILST